LLGQTNPGFESHSRFNWFQCGTSVLDQSLSRVAELSVAGVQFANMGSPVSPVRRKAVAHVRKRKTKEATPRNEGYGFSLRLACRLWSWRRPLRSARRIIDVGDKRM
jgi:hypothetical protein